MRLHKNKYIFKQPKLTFLDIIRRLKKEPIAYEEFLQLLENSNDKFYENSELEFELLLING